MNEVVQEVRLETLVTPKYTDKSANEVIQILNTMINKYLQDTGSVMINCVEYGFNTGKRGKFISAYARLCVYHNLYLSEEKEDNDEKNDEVIDVETDNIIDVDTDIDVIDREADDIIDVETEDVKETE